MASRNRVTARNSFYRTYYCVSLYFSLFNCIIRMHSSNIKESEGANVITLNTKHTWTKEWGLIQCTPTVMQLLNHWATLVKKLVFYVLTHQSNFLYTKIGILNLNAPSWAIKARYIEILSSYSQYYNIRLRRIKNFVY